MPLPNPWKSPSSASPSSPIRRKTSLRHRNKVRITLLVLVATLAVCAVNEFRCMWHGCISLLGLFGAGMGRSGGATLPDDWKYRLGEQLKLNVQGTPKAEVSAPAPPSDNKADEKKVDGGGKGLSNGALVEPLGIEPTIDPGAQRTDKDDGGRWIDAPPGPVAPGKEMKEQMQAEKQTYVDGLDSTPSPLPSPGVQAAAEDLRVGNETGSAAGDKGSPKKGAGSGGVEPPKLDKTKAKVDDAIKEKTVAEASPASLGDEEPEEEEEEEVVVEEAEEEEEDDEATELDEEAEEDSELEDPAPSPSPLPKSKTKAKVKAKAKAKTNKKPLRPQTAKTKASQSHKSKPQPQPHTPAVNAPHTHELEESSKFGSMEMGLLMAGS